jgi:MFS transporter, DHA1 family, multidrug resistance protein
MSQSLLRPALVLGVLSSIGPFSIDMYLPSLPAIGQDLATTPQVMQGTIMAYFVAMGLGQMVYGPWADQAGRKLPLYAGIGIFLLGTLWCIFATSGNDLLAGRFIQGLGGAAMGVVPRAIVRDMMTGSDATRLMSAIMLVFSVSPMLAPLAGSALLEITGWRGIFVALLGAGAMSLAMLAWGQPETLRPENRQPIRPAHILKGCRDLLAHRRFMLLTLVPTFGFGSFFIFLAAAPFVYQQGFGLSSMQFSLAFALNAMAFIGASQGASAVSRLLGVLPALKYGAAGFALANLVLLAVTLAGGLTLWGLVALLAIGNAFMGLILPSAMVLALDDQGARAGLASSLGGTLQLLVGAVGVGALSPWLGADPLAMVAGIAASATLTLVLALMVRSPQAAARAV